MFISISSLFVLVNYHLIIIMWTNGTLFLSLNKKYFWLRHSHIYVLSTTLVFNSYIINDCFVIVKVGTQTLRYKMSATNSKLHSWETYREDTTSLEESSTCSAPGLLEQMNVTRDSSDYLWYTTSVDIASSESFLRSGQKPTLTVDSRGHALLRVFINDVFAGMTVFLRWTLVFVSWYNYKKVVTLSIFYVCRICLWD